MFRKIMTVIVAVIAATSINIGPVLAQAGTPDQSGGNLPAPGVLGLVAIGVIGAIAIARSRK